MINNITVCPDGHIIPDSDSLGRTGEHNATVLNFLFFEKFNGEELKNFEKYLVALFPEGEKRYKLNDDKFQIPSELTEATEIYLRIDLEKGNEVLFKSEVKCFAFTDSDIIPAEQQKNHPLIGNLDNLKTKNKENLVNAINEVFEHGSSGGSTPDVDLSDYVKKSEMPKIDVDDIFEKVTSTVNLYQPATEGWIDNSYIQLSGEITKSEDFCVSPKISAKPNTTYSINSWNYGEFFCYDNNDNYIGYSSFRLESGDVGYSYGTTKENTAYIRLNVPKSENFNSSFMLVEGVGVTLTSHKLKENVILSEIGDISLLETRNKNNLVGAINEIRGTFSTQGISLETNEDGGLTLVFGDDSE